ncbi:glycosyltransferase family 39 protein [Candidatus Woesearchaeota archaeon]|nr:glycosyltransferase family 39 protein [Candidatus Woesearchaeota archaeon]
MDVKKNMKEWFAIDKHTLLFILILLLFIGSNAYFLNNQFAYNERKHAQVALDVFSEDKTHINYFYESSASPHTSFIPIAFIKGIFKNDLVVASRTYIFTISILFLMIVVLFVSKILNPKTALLAMLLLAVHPMFMVYGKYVVADVPFVFFATLALVLFYLGREQQKDKLVWKYDIFGVLCLGIAFLIKYNAIILYPIIGIYLFILLKCTWSDIRTWNREKLYPLIKISLFYGLISVAMVLPMIIWIKTKYGSLIPAKWHDSLFYEAWKYSIPQFSSYLLWLGLFAGVVSLFLLVDLYHRIVKLSFFKSEKNKKNLIIAFIGLLVLHSVLFYVVHTQLNPLGIRGEMNLGWLEKYIPVTYLTIGFYFILLLGELLFINFLMIIVHEKNNFNRFLSLWIVVSMVVMSFTRPANRYMMIIFFPLVTYTAQVVNRYYQKKYNAIINKKVVITLVVLHVIIFLALGVLSNIYLRKLGIEMLPKVTVSLDALS